MLAQNDEKTQKQLEQDELAEILGETFENSSYRDQEIKDILETGDGPTPFLSTIFEKNRASLQMAHPRINRNKSNTQNSKYSLNSHSSRSEYSHSEEEQSEYRQSLGSLSFERMSSADRKNSDFMVEKSLQKNEESREFSSSSSSQQDKQQRSQIKYFSHFKCINAVLKANQSSYSLEEIKDLYPNFILSEPSYKIQKSYEEQTFPYNTLKNVNITCMHVGFCELAAQYRIAVGTDDGRIAIFQRNYSKPVNIFAGFGVESVSGRVPSIKSIKWSKNLQFLTVSSSNKQLKVYSFKQPITIEDQNILRMRKQPIQLIYLTKKQLQYSIASVQYVSESPIEIILVDDNDQIWVLNYRKHIVSFRPYLSQFPIKFNDVFNVCVHEIEFRMNFSKAKEDQRIGYIMAVGSRSYVTICLIKPYFEVILAYDKQKRGKSISKDGYAHISFRRNPQGILIVWGKYANLLQLQINGYSQRMENGTVKERVQVKVSNIGELMLPEDTLVAGLNTDTLMYQLSQGGLKIYSCTNFKMGQLTKFYQPIHMHNFSLLELPNGLQILEEVGQNKIPSLYTLRSLHTFAQSCKELLFLTTSTSLFSVRIKNFQEHIHNLIQNLNNWKVGLQMLVDCYHGKHQNFDNITKQVILKNVGEYVLKYINFLEVVIGFEGGDRKGNKRQLWEQEITFVFNIVLETKLFRYLGEILLPRINLLYEHMKNEQGEGLSVCLCPFIKLRKVKVVSRKMVSILIEERVPRSIISYLLCNIDVQENEGDLAHSLNQLLLAQHYYLQLIIINHMFSDYYTPFAVLISQLQLLKHSQANQEQIDSLTQLVAWSLYTILCSINQIKKEPLLFLGNSFNYKNSKNIIETLLPLLQTSIIPNLLSSQQESVLFEEIIPQLYSSKCLQCLNDISNKLIGAANHRDLMTEIITNIDINLISDISIYWICVVDLASKFVIKMDLFMGIRYLTAHQVDPVRLEISFDKLSGQLQRQFSTISKNILEEYFLEIEHTNYITLIIIIGKLTQQHIKVIHALNSNSSNRHNKLYQYLQQNVPQMTNKQLNSLYSLIYENLDIFIEIDVDQLCGFLLGKMGGLQDHERILKLMTLVEKGDVNPRMRLSFIQKLVIESRKGHKIFNGEHMMKIKLIYIQMLALNGRKQEILEQIKNNEYPIDESLSICRYYDVDDAQAHLLVKSGGEGDIGTAIDLYFKILSQKFSQYLSRPHSQPLLMSNFLQQLQPIQAIINEYLLYFTTIITECLKICGDLLDQFFHVAHKLHQIKDDWYHDHDAYPVDLLSDYINSHIYSLFAKSLTKTIPITSLIQYFEFRSNLSSIDLLLLNKIIHEIMKIIIFQKQMYLLTQETYVASEEDLRKTIIQDNNRGYRAKSNCDVCHQKDINSILVHYNSCKHIIHPSCSEDMKFCLICKDQSRMVIEKSLDTIRKIKVDLYSYSDEKEVEEGSRMQRFKTQKRAHLLDRLKQYDDLL